VGEKRRSERVLTFKTGRIVLLDAQIDTAVLDVSTEGACLLVPDIADVPETFQLVLDPDFEKRSCEVRWKSGHRIGIRFQ
jgi:hypothetical protein